MHNFWLSVVVISAALALFQTVHGSCRGCVELDELTFDRTLRRFPDGALVKFDVAYPYGEKHEEFAKFAADVANATRTYGSKAASHEDLLVAVVGVKDYGEKDNDALARRCEVENGFPEIQLYVNGASGDRFVYPRDEPITAENLKQFVRRHSRVYVNLAGCVRELDNLAQKFTQKISGGADGADELASTDRWLELKIAENNESMVTAGRLYRLLMKRISQQGLPYVRSETERVRGLLKEKIAANKRWELEARLNVLKAFEVRAHEQAEPIFDEL